MPISPIVLQRRLTEVGRIRIGETVPAANGKTRPAKLSEFRITSPDRSLLDQISALYGGVVESWQPQGGGAPQFEVKTSASELPVMVPPQSVTQFLEHWSGGGCQRRCTGEINLLTGDECLCSSEDSMICKPTTRLSLLLRDVRSIGTFRLESHGWNAVAELPGMADLLASAGGYVPARLYLKPVRQVSGGKTKDFYVPALAVDGVTPAELLASGGFGITSVNRTTGELPANAPKAIGSAPTDCSVFINAAMESRNAQTVRDIWRDAAGAGCLDAPVTIGGTETTLKGMLTTLGQKFAEMEKSKPPVGPDSQAERVQVWTGILAGWQGDTNSALDAFHRASGGREPADCTVAELVAFGEMMAVPVEAEKPALQDPEF